MPTFRDLPTEIFNYLPQITNRKLELDESIDSTDEYGDTVLHSAVHAQKFPVVQALLKAKANCNIFNGHGSTAIFLAHGRHPGDMIRLLVSNGARLDLRRQGKTLLDYDLLLEGELFINHHDHRQNLHKVEPWMVEHFEFGEGVKGLMCKSMEQRIADTQGRFSAIAEAIYLKICDAKGDFKVDLEALKKYSSATLSEKFWNNLLEYGKRIHAEYIKQSLPIEPTESELSLAKMLTERAFREALSVESKLSMDLLLLQSGESTEKTAQNTTKAMTLVFSKVQARLLSDANMFGNPSNPAYRNGMGNAIATCLKQSAQICEELVSHPPQSP